jgi:hypothetical protein
MTVAALALGVGSAWIGAALLKDDSGKAVDAFALVALAGAMGTFAVRGVLRRTVAVVVAAAGVGVLTVGLSTAHPGADALVGPGGGLILLTGLSILRHAKGWPSMSTRYEREQRAAGKPLSAWDAIDRGEDPTA